MKKNKEIEYDIVINTDSDTLIEMMKSNPLRKVDIIKRAPSLAGDTIGKIAVINNCLEEMRHRNKILYDVVLDLDITSPLRTVEDIEKILKKHFDKRPDVTTSVVPARRNPYFNQLKPTEKGMKRVIESDFTARQQAPEIFDMNASI